VSRVQKECISAWQNDTYIKAAPTFAEAITAFRTYTPPHIEAAVFEQVEYQFSYKELKHGGCHIKSKLIPPDLLALSVGPLTASTAPGSVAERLATSAFWFLAGCFLVAFWLSGICCGSCARANARCCGICCGICGGIRRGTFCAIFEQLPVALGLLLVCFPVVLWLLGVCCGCCARTNALCCGICCGICSGICCGICGGVIFGQLLLVGFWLFSGCFLVALW
jgi:hypothetical protein